MTAPEWVGDYVSFHARTRRDVPAIVVPELGVSLTYRQLEQQIARAGGEWMAMGLRPGNRIAYYGQNTESYYVALFAAIRGGFVLVPLNWRCADPEIAFLLHDSQAELIICDEAFLPRAQAATERLDTPPRLISTDAFRALVSGDGPAMPDAIPWDEATVCLQLYTSGTTGRPKGVMARHHALSVGRRIEAAWSEFPGWEGGTILSAMPNFHIGGMSWMLMGVQRGSTCVLTADASPTNILRLLRDHAVAQTFIVPTVLNALVGAVRGSGEALPALRTIFYGAAPMSAALLHDAIDVLGCEFGQFFGMTEVTGCVTFLSPAQHDVSRPERLRSVGCAYPGMAVEIRDVDARPVAQGSHGEIWIRTPGLMSGYWKQPEATAEVVRDGWYRSGDGGYRDEDGFLYLTDRIKDMIVSGGENVYPVEVETALRVFPGVADLAIVGVPDERWGESVAALVETNRAAAFDVEAFQAFARTQLATYKCPKRVACTAALPRTASGKVQRGIARTMLLEGNL